jgi:hypothetical protein
LVVHVHVTSLDIYDTGLQNGTLWRNSFVIILNHVFRLIKHTYKVQVLIRANELRTTFFSWSNETNFFMQSASL